MESKINFQIPITIEQQNCYQVGDTRFIPVKIWLLHLNENLNGSFFVQEVVDEAIPTLANTPILGFIENGDFSDHREVLKVTKDNITLEYKGSSFGVIPESNNAHYEDRLCDDGITRTFLCCDGLIWTKWDEPVEILKNGLIKGQSMELDKDYYEGHYNQDGYFQFSKFRFFGACILGEDVTPAMKDSTIEVQFTTNEIKSKLEQFTNFMKQLPDENPSVTVEEGGTKLDEKLEILSKFNKTVEDLDFSIEDMSLADLSVKMEELFSVKTEPLKTTEVPVAFSVTYNQKRQALSNALDPIIVKDSDGNYVEETYYYVSDFDDSYVFVERDFWNANGYECTHGRFSYTFDEINIEATVTSEFEEMYRLWLTLDEKNKLEEDRKNYSAIVTDFENYKKNYSIPDEEVEVLKNYKQEKEVAERKQAEENLFSMHEETIGNTEEFAELKKNASNYTMEELQKECFYICGLHSFSVLKDKKEEVVTGVKFSVSKPTEGEDEIDALYKKYLNQ